MALLVDRRLRGVEVLRVDPVVVEQPAGPEADHVSGRVPDRPQQASAKPVVVASPALRDEPAGDELLVLETLLAQVLEQRIPVTRRETDPEPLRGLLVESALGQELSTGHGIG